MKWIKQLFCKHDWTLLVENITYCAEAEWMPKYSFTRWQCNKCEKYKSTFKPVEDEMD